MASKYPSREYLDSSSDSSFFVMINDAWNKNKIIFLSLLLGVLFYIVSMPKVYSFTDNLFKLNNDGMFNNQQALIHAVVFAVLSLVLIKFTNSA